MTRNITLGLLASGAALWMYSCDRAGSGATTQSSGGYVGHSGFHLFGGGSSGVGSGTVRGGFGHSFGGGFGE